jgi:ABC-2 type transport system permease protein
MLQIQGLRKRFGDRRAVDGVSFEIAPGEIVGVLGPNGAGKTTTVSLIAGLLPADEGEVRIGGQPLRGDTDPAKRQLGLVPQELALYDELSARANLRFFGGLYGLSGDALDRRMASALELVGLQDRANHRVATFSGGMKRRLNLAAGLLHDPSILLLDEPTVGVDPQSRNAIFDNLEALKRQGKALLYTTHYMEEAERLCDRIVIIDQGAWSRTNAARLLRLAPRGGPAGDRARRDARGRRVAGRAARASRRHVRDARRRPAERRHRHAGADRVAGARVPGRARARLPAPAQRARRPGGGLPGPHRPEAARRMSTLWAVVRKDLELFRTDKRAVLMQIVAPIVISAFFGFVFSRADSKDAPARVSVRVVDQDGSAIARGLVEGLAGDRMLDARPATLEVAREDVRSGRAPVAIVIPAGFGDAARDALFRPSRAPEMPVLFDPSHAAERALVEGLLTQHAMQAVSRQAFSSSGVEAQMRSIEESSMDPARKAALRSLLASAAQLGTAGQGGGGGLPAMSLPYSVREEAVTAGGEVPYNGFSHAFAGMSVQFILFAGINLGVSMLLDRQRGVWKRLRAAPLSKGFVLGSRTLSGALIAFLTLAIVFGAAIALFGVRVQGSWVGFVAVLVGIAFMSSTFGLLIAALGKTPEATRGISIFAVLIMVMLGGAWVPTFQFPAWMQRATMIVPARWAVDGIEAMTWRGLPLVSALPAIGALFGFAIVFEVLALLRFRWEAD